MSLHPTPTPEKNLDIAPCVQISRFTIFLCPWCQQIEKYYDIYKMNRQIHEEEVMETHSAFQKKNYLDIKVIFRPSCGRPNEKDYTFFPFKLPPLDKSKTDLKMLKATVEHYLQVG